MLKKQNGFTLIEMLIVMLIISILLILIIPNFAKQTENVDEKGCEALVAMVQAQSDSYYLDNRKYAGEISILRSSGYIDENQQSCSNNKFLTIDSNGVVSVN